MRALAAGLLIACVVASASGQASDKGAGELLDRWLAAQGGLERLKAVRGYDYRETIRRGPGSRTVEIHVVQTSNGRFRYETAYPWGGTLVQASDGIVCWQGNDRLGYGLIPNSAVPPLYLEEDLLTVLLVDRVYPKHRLLGDGEAQGRRCKVAEMTGRDGVGERFYFDVETGRCLRIERPRNGHPGEWNWTEYSDFRTVDGLVLPFTTAIDRGDDKITRTRSDLVINPRLDTATFMISTARFRELRAIEDILARNLAEAGGDAIGRIHSRVTRAHVETSNQSGKDRETISQKEPDYILKVSETPGMGTKWTGFDGTVGWSTSEVEGFHLLKAPEVAAMRNYGKLSDEGHLADRWPLRKMVGRRQVNGRATHAVILSTFQFQGGTFYFDDENGRLLRMTSIFGDSDGHFEATQDFSDFRRMDGVEKPFVITQTDPTGKSVETIESIENNVPLDNSIFRPRKGDW